MRGSSVLSVFCVLVPACALSAAPSITDGLLVPYDFEEILDGVVPDRSPNGYDGTVGGTSDLTIIPDGVFGHAGSFEGPTEAYIDLPRLPHEEIPTDAISVVARVNHAPMAEHMEIFMAMSADPVKQLCHFELRVGDMARMLIRTPIDPPENIVDIINVPGVPAEAWVDYAATYDRHAGMAYLYLDGVEVAQYAATREMLDDWDMGARVGWCVDAARPFIGLMDEFAVWRRALSPAEIEQVMDEGIGAGPEEVPFIRGDTDGDGAFTIGDGVQILERLFTGRAAFTSGCDKTGDLDDDEALTIGDAVIVFNYLFAGGRAPAEPPPVGRCGADPDPDPGCEATSPACR